MLKYLSFIKSSELVSHHHHPCIHPRWVYLLYTLAAVLVIIFVFTMSCSLSFNFLYIMASTYFTYISSTNLHALPCSAATVLHTLHYPRDSLHISAQNVLPHLEYPLPFFNPIFSNLHWIPNSASSVKPLALSLLNYT